MTLLETTRLLASGLEHAGIAYRIEGDFAVQLHVAATAGGFAHVRQQASFAVGTQDASAVQQIVNGIGCPANGLRLTTDSGVVTVDPSTALSVEDSVRLESGFFVTPLPDLVRWKLGRYRIEDRLHIQDIDSAGLITPEIEAALPTELASRLAEIRVTE